MLTSSLIRARVAGGKLRPKFVDPADGELLDLAAQLTDLLGIAGREGWSRGQVDAELAELCEGVPDRKLADGLAKIGMDRAEFAAAEELVPSELRAAAFRLAARRGPLAMEPGPLDLPTADTVLAEVAAQRGVTLDAVRSSLFADLRDAHRIGAYPAIEPVDLLHRYNLALVQSILLSATEVRIVVRDPTAARIRQLLRWARFYQLIHAAERKDGKLVITLDGPASLFTQSTRYGMQLASFFPAIVLQDAAWELTASVAWTRQRTRRDLVVKSDEGLRTHWRDTGGHATREQAWFAERFAAATTPWTLEPGSAPIDLGGQAVIVPDFTLRNGGREAHLEILGYWRPEWLQRRLELLRRHGRGNVIVAVSRKLCADERPGEGWGPEVVEFSAIVPPKAVIELAERMAVEAG